MSRFPLRFLHTGDFRLHLPVHGLPQVPPHLKDPFLDAPYQAVRRAFDAAEQEEVDFVLLTGPLLDDSWGGAQDAAFLTDQFRRLQRRGIEVFVAGDRTLSQTDWPDAAPLPANVHWLCCERAERYIVRRDGAALASVAPATESRLGPRGALYHEADAGLFSVVAAPRWPARRAPSNALVDYLGFGGAAAEETLPGVRPLAHCPGSPQGRSPEEEGPHGATLVEVDAELHVRIRRIETDAIRFVCDTVHAGPHRFSRDVEEELDRRAEALRRAAPGRLHVVRWIVSGEGPAVRELLSGADAEMLQRLRERHGHGPSGVWTSALEVAPAFDDAWRDHLAEARHSVINEYLDRLGRWQADAGAELPRPVIDEACRLVGSPNSQRVAATAARLGVELLAQGGAQP